MVYIFCWVFGCSRRCSSLSIAFQANWAPANWVLAYWALANQAPRKCWCGKLGPFIIIIQGPNLPHQHFPWVQFAGAQFAKKMANWAPKSAGPNLPPNQRGAQFPRTVFRCATILWSSHSCFLGLVDLCQILPQVASSLLVNIGSQHYW